MTVIAPQILQAGRIEPYVSVEEVKFSPTASAIDFSNLVENGAQAAQDRALYELIVRASSKADQYTMGQYGTLNATSNTEAGRYRMTRWGEFRIHPSFSPLLEVSDFTWGPTPGSQTQITLSSDNCWIERDEFVITNAAAAGTVPYFGINAYSSVVRSTNTGLNFCTFTYVSGWANSFLTASASAGATSLTLLDVTGVYPGMTEFIWDGVNDEQVTVSESYVPGTNPVSLASATLYNHGIGCNVSALPASVKQAVIHFVVAMVKQRGQGGLVLNEMGAGEAVTAKVETSDEDEIMGMLLLDQFKVTWGRM